MDIRNYFSPKSQSKKTEEFKPKKRKHVIESDEEDPFPSKSSSKRENILASDSDDEIFVVKQSKKNEAKKSKVTDKKLSHSKTSPSKNRSTEQPEAKTVSQKNQTPKLKPISASDFFGSSPVFQSKVVNDKKPKSRPKNDEDKFEETLTKLDESEDIEMIGEEARKEEVNENSPPNKLVAKGKGLASKLSEKLKSSKHRSESSTRIPDSKTAEDQGKKRKLGNDFKANAETSPHVKSSRLSETRQKDLDLSKADSRDHRNEDGSPLRRKSPRKKSHSGDGGEYSSSKTPEKTSKGRQIPSKEGKSESNQHKDHKNSSSKTPDKTPKNRKEATSKGENENKQDDGDKDLLASTPDPEEQRKQRSMAYRKFLQRSGPRNPGGKALPEGSASCLSGLTFVLTGVLETIDREETAELIKKCGGRVTSSVSKNTSYLVLGDDPGQSKVSKAEKLKTKILDEDQLFDLIRTNTVPSSPKESPKSAKSKGMSSQDSHAIKSETTSVCSQSPVAKPISTSLNSPSYVGKSSPLSSKSSSQRSSVCSQKTEPISSQDLAARPTESLMWVDKYKPQSLKNIIGQQGDQSNAKKLLNWLRNWTKSHSGQPTKSSRGGWGGGGSDYKAALLSGPPGVGKTTTAVLVCRELGFDTVELNASDARSKKRLGEEVAELLVNKNLASFVTAGSGGAATSRNHALLMDEVDGMSGNEDRGGVQELIALIKASKIPVICLCNDRNHPKIRSLANHCLDLRFYKPRVEQIRAAMQTVAFREGIRIKPDALDQMIRFSNQDIRQVLHHLSMWSSDTKNLDEESVKKDAEKAHKEFKLGPWDVCMKVFSESAHKGMSIHDKVSLFFHDYSIGPLFVQENYLKVAPHSARGDRKKHLRALARTAESLADSDLIDKAIRSHSAWGLLPTQAIFSSVLPGDYMEGHMSAQVEFPKWLGNNSRRNKFDRISQELQLHTRLKISGTKLDIIMDYAVPLRNAIVGPLAKRGSDGVQDAVNASVEYDLPREDLDSLLELTSWPRSKNLMAEIDKKVKSEFTRKLNKESHLSPFSTAGSGVSKKKLSSAAEEGLDGEDEGEDQEEEDDDIAKDNMIKVGKSSQKSNKGTSQEGTSKSKGKGGNTKQASKRSKK